MHKLALMSAVCLAALALPGGAYAEAPPTGFRFGHTDLALEVTKCGSKVCGRMVSPQQETTTKKSCDTRTSSSARPAGKSAWDLEWIYDADKKEKPAGEFKSAVLDKLQLMADVGSKLFSDQVAWKSAATDTKTCDEAASKPQAAPAPSEKKAVAAPVEKKAAPAQVAGKSPTPPSAAKAPAVKAEKSGPTAHREPALDATKAKVAAPAGTGHGCTKYFSQIGKTVSVPCE